MPTAEACTSVFDAAVAAATRLRLTLTPLLFEVALAAMVPVLAIVMLSLPLPASMPVALDRTKVLVSLCARSIRLSLTLVLLTSDVAFAVKAPLLDISSLPAPPLMPTARVSSVVVAVTSAPPVSVSDRVLLLDVAEAFTVSAPSLRRMSLPLPPSIPTALTAPASEMSCGLESCDRLLEGDIGALTCAEGAACVADAATVIVPVLTMTSSPLAPTMPFALTCGLAASEDALTAMEPLLLIWSLPLPPRMPMLAAVGLTGRRSPSSSCLSSEWDGSHCAPVPLAAADCTAIAPRLLTRSLPPPPAMPTAWTVLLSLESSRYAEQAEDFPAGAAGAGLTVSETRPSLTTESFPEPASTAVANCGAARMMLAPGRMVMLSSADID